MTYETIGYLIIAAGTVVTMLVILWLFKAFPEEPAHHKDGD